MGDWKEESIRHKYEPLPEDAPRHVKKAKKRHVRSDHKHDYETVCIDAHTRMLRIGKNLPCLYLGSRCKICGRVLDVKLITNLVKPPKSMPLYEVDTETFLRSKYLPEKCKVSE